MEAAFNLVLDQSSIRFLQKSAILGKLLKDGKKHEKDLKNHFCKLHNDSKNGSILKKMLPRRLHFSSDEMKYGQG